eukprot:8272788-Lingulodinium_polyedra.AAC.1
MVRGPVHSSPRRDLVSDFIKYGLDMAGGNLFDREATSSPWPESSLDPAGGSHPREERAILAALCDCTVAP